VDLAPSNLPHYSPGSQPTISLVDEAGATESLQGVTLYRDHNTIFDSHLNVSYTGFEQVGHFGAYAKVNKSRRLPTGNDCFTLYSSIAMATDRVENPGVISSAGLESFSTSICLRHSGFYPRRNLLDGWKVFS